MCHSKSQMNKFWYIFGGEHQMHDTNSWDSYYYSLVRGNQKLLFPADLPIERLMQEHDSKPQNPIIANVLYKSKILESWGRGIGTMVDECKRVGLPAPEFNTDGNFVWVVFKYNRNSVVVTPQLMKVITVIRDNMMAAKEIMKCIKLKDKTYFLDKYLYPAMEDGYVEQLYPDNPKHPKQKYLLTEKGKALLR